MNKTLKIFLAALLITSFVVPFTIPRPINAASAPKNITVCTGAGLLANYISGLIGDFRGSGLTVPVNEGGLRNKEGVLDVAARCFARQLFDGSISGILNTVRTSGRDGSAAYVKDWRNFITSAEYRGEDIFRGILSNATLCNYIDKDIKDLFGVTKKIPLPPSVQTRVGNLDPYQLRANCTMPSGFNLDNYKKDFAGNGGWAAFSRLLEPQNNYYGALFGALDESAKQRDLEKSADTNEVISGDGYTARRKACQSTGGGPRCVVLGTILTPGSTLSGAVKTTFQSELDWLANSDELNEVIASLVERFTNRLIDIGAPDPDQKYGPDPTVPTPDPEPDPGGGTCSGPPLPIPPGSPPNMSSVVNDVASEFPQYLTNSCQNTGGTWEFMDEVVNRLHSQDPNWGYNGKRGTSTLSEDAISYLAGGTTEVFIIDVIQGHCGNDPRPTWNDVTAETYSCGVTGAYVYPR